MRRIERQKKILALCKEQAQLIDTLWQFLETGKNETQIRAICAVGAKAKKLGIR
jgi:hypothetical protein